MAAKSKTSKNKTNFFSVDNKTLIYALIVLLVVIVLNWALKMGARNYGSPVPQPAVVENSYPAIVSGDDLDKASKELDKTDLNAIDKDLTGLDSESSSF